MRGSALSVSRLIRGKVRRRDADLVKLYASLLENREMVLANKNSLGRPS